MGPPPPRPAPPSHRRRNRGSHSNSSCCHIGSGVCPSSSSMVADWSRAVVLHICREQHTGEQAANHKTAFTFSSNKQVYLPAEQSDILCYASIMQRFLHGTADWLIPDTATTRH